MSMVLAASYFSSKNIDVALIETGLGGRLDATNVLTPLFSLITHIGLDHQAYLGDTLPEIAREKAGIIKEGVPVLLGSNMDPALYPVFEEVRSEERRVGKECRCRGTAVQDRRRWVVGRAR